MQVYRIGFRASLRSSWASSQPLARGTCCSSKCNGSMERVRVRGDSQVLSPPYLLSLRGVKPRSNPEDRGCCAPPGSRAPPPAR